MKRISLVVAVAAFGTLLSGCEALQTQKNATAQPAAPAAAAAPTAQNPPAPPTVPATPPSAAAAPNGAPQPAAGAAQQQGAPVLFLLAQPEKAQGLNELKLKDGSLWYLPQPALSRDDLTRVTPLQEKDGKGVVRFDFNPAGAKKLADLSQKFQGKYLVLVVGRDVVAAPRIAGAMNQGAMFIVVPNAAQAQAITQDIAGARQ